MHARFPSAVALVCAAACGGKEVGGGTSSSRIVKQVVLAISVQGEGTVKGASSDCRGSCTQSFSVGDRVSLAAVADTGTTFSGWSGACAGQAICDLVLDRDTTVTAAFVRAQGMRRQLVVAVDGHGKVVSWPAGIDCGASCSAAYPDGQAIALSAHPDPGYAFSGWTGACAGMADCHLSLTSDGVRVGARFEALPPPAPRAALLAVTVTGSGSVHSTPEAIACAPLCSATVHIGDSVSLVAAAMPGNRFIGWSGACAGKDPICKLEVSGDTLAAAEFDAEMVVLADHQYSYSSATLSSKDVLWETWIGNGYAINAVSKTGGPVRQLVSLGYGYASALAADDDWIYFSQYDPALQRQRLVRASSSGANATAIGDAYGGMNDIVFDATNVYWVTQSNLMTMPRKGGTPVWLGPALQAAGGVAVDATDVYVTTFDGIYRIAKSTGVGERVFVCSLGACSGWTLRVDDAYLYFRGNNGVLYAKKKGSNAFFNVSNGQGENRGGGEFAISGAAVYWLGGNALFAGQLDGTGTRVLDGGASTNLGNLQVDDKYIYYIIDGRLTRRLK